MIEIFQKYCYTVFIVRNKQKMLEVGQPFVLPTKREMSHVGKKIWSIITNAIALTVRTCTFTTPVMTEAVGTSNGRNIKLSSNEFKIKSFNNDTDNCKITKEKSRRKSDNGDCADFVSNVNVQGIGTEEILAEFNLNKVLNISLSERSNIIIKCYDKDDRVLISKFKYYDEYLIDAMGRHAYGLSKPILQSGKYFIKINNKDTTINVLDVVKVELIFVDSSGESKSIIFKK